MKIVVSLFLGLLLFGFTNDLFAQNRKITIILLRHAEKDLSGNEDNPDPDLSAAGKLRAERLVKTIKKYKPMRLYATDYKRTRQTATPLSEKRKLPIQIYDSKKLDELAAQILSFRKSRRIVVVGHNSTTPALANLLVKQDKYKPLAESEYDKIWIIRIKKGKIKAKVFEY